MENAVQLKVIAPTGIVLDTAAQSVRLPAADGSLGVHKGHAKALVLLNEGEISYLKDGTAYTQKIPPAFAEIKDDVVTVILQ